MLWTFIGHFDIEVNDLELITRRNFLGYNQIKKYSLNRIKKLEIRTNTQTPTFIGLPGRHGKDIGIHYKNPIVLYFEYISSHENLGHYCEPFPAEELLQEILKRKQLIKE